MQVLAQIELWTNTAKYPVGVYFLPKKVRNHFWNRLCAKYKDANVNLVKQNEGPWWPDCYTMFFCFGCPKHDESVMQLSNGNLCVFNSWMSRWQRLTWTNWE